MKALVLFGVAYFTLVSLARKQIKPKWTGRYTWYTYVYAVLLWLLPQKFGRRAFWFVHNSTLGCFLGIEWIWYIDEYKALWELGRRSLRKEGGEELTDSEKKKIVVMDLIIHTLPYILVLLYFKRYSKSGRFNVPPGTGFVTGMAHVCYCLLITGTFDATTLYRVKPRSKELLAKAWTGVFVSHLLAEQAARLLIR